MLSCFLLVSQLHAASVAWYADPVVVDLHPVRFSYWERYHQHYLARATGPRASPVVREPMAASSVYYALLDATWEQPLLDDQVGEQWRDMSISSASIAAEALLWETLGRSPELGGAVRFMRTFVSPNLELERRPEGWKARANDPDIRMRPELERRELQEGMFPHHGNPVPTLTVGSGLDLEELDSLTDRQREVDAAAWLRFQHMGIDQLTLRGLLLAQAWELSARQRLVPGLSAAAAVSSRPASPLPEEWGTGLTWNLPSRRWWTVVLRYRHDIPMSDQELAEWNLRLMVRWLPPAKAPIQPGSWPLGQRIATAGPVRPSASPGQPVQATSVLPVAPGLEESAPEGGGSMRPSGSSGARR